MTRLSMQLGITTIQRDRAPWIKEWIAFHYLVGFRKFYIFAHNCSDDTVNIITKLKENFDIKLSILSPEMERPQLKCYQDAYTNFGQEVDWMAFIDADEFLFPTSDSSIKTALEEFNNKKISALGVYWSCFGSSNHITEPSGLIIKNYKYRAKDGYHNNRHIKSIVRGGQGTGVQIVGTPHIFKTPLGTYDENLRPITGSGWTDYEPTYKKFRINHYVCQSRSFFLNFKQRCGNPDGDRFYIRPESWWEEHNKNDVLDNSMDKFIKPLKNILNSI